MSASLAVSVDTVSAQAKEINILHQHINALKKKGTPNVTFGTNAGGGMTENVCTRCAAVRCLDSHKKGSCYFNPKKITERREWDCSLIDKKRVLNKDNDGRQGGSEIVVNINSIKETLSYDSILRFSPPPGSIPTLPPNTTTVARRSLPQRDNKVLKSCATHLYIAPTDTHSPRNTSTQFFCVGTATRHVERLLAMASLPIPQLVEKF